MKRNIKIVVCWILVLTFAVCIWGRVKSITCNELTYDDIVAVSDKKNDTAPKFRIYKVVKFNGENYYNLEITRVDCGRFENKYCGELLKAVDSMIRKQYKDCDVSMYNESTIVYVKCEERRVFKIDLRNQKDYELVEVIPAGHGKNKCWPSPLPHAIYNH